jgi:hypothetical protein
VLSKQLSGDGNIANYNKRNKMEYLLREIGTLVENGLPNSNNQIGRIVGHSDRHGNPCERILRATYDAVGKRNEISHVIEVFNQTTIKNNKYPEAVSIPNHLDWGNLKKGYKSF